MKLHANAALSVTQRRRMVRLVVERWVDGRRRRRPEFSASPRTCSKWVARFRRGPESGLLDRSSAPELVANRTDEQRIAVIAALRRLRFTGPEIAEVLGMPLSTVSGILTRIGMGKLGRLGLEPAQRYERARPGRADPHRRQEARAGSTAAPASGSSAAARTTRGSFTDAAGRRRGKAGWDFVHIAIDDATRLAYAEVLADENAITAVGFLRRAIAHFFAATASPSSAC